MSLDPFHIPSHVHGFAALVAGYEAASESTRARLPSQLNIPYGEGPDEKLDLFFPEEPHDGARPIHMFIHGGYWRAQTKERYAFVADEVTAAGAIAAIIDYSLMPRARMATLVDQTRRAARWLGEHASTFGGDIGGRIKIISNVGLTQNLQFIKDGNIQAADVVYDNTYEGYAAVDQLIRVLTGKDLYKTPGVTDMRFAYNENVPQHLVTKENVGDPTVLWIAGNDAVKHYRELWGVEPRLSVRNLSVRFGTHLALDSLDLDVPAGRIIALLGANGSGKSTTVKALTGINPVGSGCRVSVGGVVLTADSFNPIAAKRLGIRVVHQEAPLVADLTVAETVAINLGFPTVGGFIRWKELTQTTLRRLGEFGVDIDPHRLCRSLNASERALVSLAIALGDIEVESAVLILDEATASLSTTDATRFLDHVREAADRGLAVLMVTHRLPEVRRYCDQIVVLRDGVTVARFDQESFDEWGVVRAMVGEPVQSGGDNHQASASRGAQVRGLDIHELSGDVLQDVTLSMRPGEIIGIAGRPGGGAAELLRALAGLEPEARGRATLGEVNLDLRSPRGPLGRGLCYISADRLNEGGIAEMTVAENLTLPKTERYGMGRARANGDADRMIAQLDIRPSAREAPFGKLSGGNQQKVILGRWLLLDPDVLLLDDPTGGVDPHTREVIFATITSLAQSGAIVLIRSSEPEQLARHCTRVVVLRDGRVTQEFVGADLNTEKISLATFA